MTIPVEPLRPNAMPSHESVLPVPSAAHVIAMSELESPRAGEPETSSCTQRPATPLVSMVGGPQNPLGHLKARLTVSVGSAELTVAELLGATEQHVLRLDRSIDQPVDVHLEGHLIARGVLVAVDDRFGVRITEIAASLEGPLASTRKV